MKYEFLKDCERLPKKVITIPVFIEAMVCILQIHFKNWQIMDCDLQIDPREKVSLLGAVRTF